MQRNGLESNKLIQMCIITTEGDRMNANWANLLGFDYAGLAVYDDPATNIDTWYRGKVSKTAGIASNAVDLVCDGQWMQFEVLQAHGEPSEWNDFMQLRGHGIHHVAFEVVGEAALPQIEEFSGRKAVQKGATFMDKDCFYGYLDTKEGMGSTIELLGFAGQLQQVHHYRETMIQMDLQGNDPKRPLAGKIPCALTLVVSDTKTAVEGYNRFLDTTPMSEGMVEDTVTMGNITGSQTYYKAVYDVISTKIEVLNPGTSNTVWSAFRDKWTDGMYAMCFESADLDGDVALLCEYNLLPIQRGQIEDMEYIILDGEADYGCMIELRTSPSIAAHVKQVEAERAERRSRYGENLTYDQSTGIGNIMDLPEVYEKLTAAVPSLKTMMDINKENKTVRRMPLGFVLRSVPGVTEEDIVNTIRVINE